MNEVMNYLLANSKIKLNVSKQENIPENYNLRLDDMGLVNSDLPDSSLWKIDNIYGVNLGKNNLTNVDFLSSLTKTSGTLLSNEINISNNVNLTDISGLSNLREVGKISLDYTGVNDLSPLENLEEGFLQLNNLNSDEFVQYSNKWDYSKSICQGLLTSPEKIKIITKDNSLTGGFDFCTTGDKWLDLFHENNKFKSYSKNIEEVPITSQESLSIYIQSKDHTNDYFPNYGFPFKKVFNFSLSDNALTNVDFLNGLESVGTGTGYSSKLDLKLNNITDLKGLSTLKRAIIDLRNNDNLNDLSGLENLETGLIYLTQKTVSDLVQSTNKFDMSTPFCQNMTEHKGSVRIILSDNYYPKTSELCK